MRMSTGGGGGADSVGAAQPLAKQDARSLHIRRKATMKPVGWAAGHTQHFACKAFLSLFLSLYCHLVHVANFPLCCSSSFSVRMLQYISAILTVFLLFPFLDLQ